MRVSAWDGSVGRVVPLKMFWCSVASRRFTVRPLTWATTGNSPVKGFHISGSSVASCGRPGADRRRL